MQKSGDEKPEKSKEGVTPDGGSSPASSTSKSEQNDMNIRGEDVAEQVLQKLSKLNIPAKEDSGQSESECSSEEESSNETDSDSEQDSPILTRSKWLKNHSMDPPNLKHVFFLLFFLGRSYHESSTHYSRGHTCFGCENTGQILIIFQDRHLFSHIIRKASPRAFH